MSDARTIYKIKAQFFDDAEVVLLVNHQVLTKEIAEEINDFCGGNDYRLLQEDGDVVRAVVRSFGAAAIHYFLADGGADFDSRSEADSTYWTQWVIDKIGEGWPDCAALGILIQSAVVSGVGFDDVELDVI